MNHLTSLVWALAVSSAAAFGLAGTAQAADPLPPETSDVATLAPNPPHRFFTSSFEHASFMIFDGDNGHIEGQIPAGYEANLEFAPDHSRFYVSETYWSHGARGTRDDLLSIYDATTLNLQKEIKLPGRALVGRVRNFGLNATGTLAYVYVMHPASSVVWVDLRSAKVGGTVEVPGCALVFPFGEREFASLCGDGSLATVTIPASGPAVVTHTKPFFDANHDPIFEHGFVDRDTGHGLFLSYTGLVYPVQLGAHPVLETPWSIQQAAGYPVAGTGVQELAWRPGGQQLAAYHKASGRLYVLMHTGHYWTHKQGGTEIWVLDTKTHALLSRFPLRAAPTSGLGDESVPFYSRIGVSQDEHPLLYLTDMAANIVLDAATGEQLRKVDFAAGGFVLQPGT